MTSQPWPDDGFVYLKHDGTAWTIVHQNGHEIDRTTAVGADDPAAARRWLRVQAMTHTDATWPADPGEGADIYALDRYDGQLVGRPAGGFRYDERGWTLTDSNGHTTHVNADLGEDQQEAAVAWAHQIHTSQPGYRPPTADERSSHGPVRYFEYHRPPAGS